MAAGMKRRLALMWCTLAVVFAAWYYVFGGVQFITQHVHDDARKVLFIVTVVVVMLVIYSFLSVVIRATGQEPDIRADMSDWYGVFIRLRFMTVATERPRIIYELTRRIHRAVQASGKVDMAIPYVYSYKRNAPPGSDLPPGQMGLDPTVRNK